MSKYEMVLEQMDIINKIDESGMRNIKAIIGDKKKATLYFHMDTDGVTSAIAMKMYLKQYGVKVTKFIPINYGGTEYKASTPEKDSLVAMVDFAHGKTFVNIWTDHHDKQSGEMKLTKTQSTSFIHTPSNAEYISQEISPRELFPPEDLKTISMVDSADFLKYNVTPEQIMNAAFEYDDNIEVERNRMMMGLIVNKLLLTYKNKPDFLASLVKEANPSLTSMYNVIKKLAKENGYKTSDQIKTGMEDYVEAQKGKIQEKGKNPEQLKNGESTIWGTTLVQYGGGGMFNGYDRYTGFKNNPDVDYQIIGWPMGLIQISKNPFKRGKNVEHLGDLAKDVMSKKWKSKLSSMMISMGDVKRIYEMDIKPQDREAMGFKYEDLMALFDHSTVKGINLDNEGGYNNFIKSVMHNKYKYLTARQKELLDKIKINLWEVIMSQSGGHAAITNISGLNFYGKGYVDELLKPMMKDFAVAMKDKKLEAE